MNQPDVLSLDIYDDDVKLFKSNYQHAKI